MRNAMRKGFKNGLMPILLFYIIAVACRAITLYVVPEFVDCSQEPVWWQLSQGIGPTLGALAVIMFFRKRLFCSVMGTSWIRSVACIVIPMVLFLALDRENGVKASGIFFGCILYAFLEEVGWRGYLTQAFADRKQFERILIITAFWFFWHMNIPMNVNAVYFFGILLLASWGLDQLAHDTHSLILCACFHGIFNLFKHGNGLLDNTLTISLLAVSIVLWFLFWYFPIHRINKRILGSVARVRGCSRRRSPEQHHQIAHY